MNLEVVRRRAVNSNVSGCIVAPSISLAPTHSMTDHGDPATRVSVFQNAISGMAGSMPIRWSSYLSAHTIEDGSIEYYPELDNSGDGPIKYDLGRLLDYSRFLLGQGFTVEVGIASDDDGVFFHLVSWEGDDEPEWPDSLEFIAVLRSAR